MLLRRLSLVTPFVRLLSSNEVHFYIDVLLSVFPFQLTTTTHVPEPCTAIIVYDPSLTKEIPSDNFAEESSNYVPDEDVDSMRRELADTKKQVLLIMSQHKKSVEKLQEALAQKDTAVTEAAEAKSREAYMLELMTESSLDMAGVCHFCCPLVLFLLPLHDSLFLLLRLLSRSCSGGPASRGKGHTTFGTRRGTRFQLLGFA